MLNVSNVRSASLLNRVHRTSILKNKSYLGWATNVQFQNLISLFCSLHDVGVASGVSREEFLPPIGEEIVKK